MTADEAFAQALTHHRAGRLAEAEGLYRAVLRETPGHPDAHHNLGMIALQVGKAAQGLPHFEAARAASPDHPQFRMSHAEALLAAGDVQAAWDLVERDRQAGRSDADFIDLWTRTRRALSRGFYNHGNILIQDGRFEDAVAYFRRALELEPDFSEALNNLGGSFMKLGRFEDATACFERLLVLKPGDAVARNNLAEAFHRQGIAHMERGGDVEAEAFYRKALALHPDDANVHVNLANTLFARKRYAEAAASAARALELRPEMFEGHVIRGNVRLLMGELDGAVESYRRALEIVPDCVEAYNNLGGVLVSMGRYGEALDAYEQALKVRPDDPGTHRNILLGITYDPRWSEEELFDFHRRFEERLARPHYPAAAVHANCPAPRRRLRVGYMSSDFRGHPVGRNLIPVIEAHDRSRVELYFYAEVRAPDEMTELYRSLADGWRSTIGCDDRTVAEMIRADGIDVLVCLAGRCDDNRPLVCAYRPAPVQISHYDAATSGLSVMDAVLTDRVMTPRGGSERFCERPMRLPSLYLHAPMTDAPDAGPPPMRVNGYPTFGSVNNPAKVSDEALRLWAKVMKKIPNARLRLKYKNWFESEGLSRRVLGIMSEQGVDHGRVELLGDTDVSIPHLAFYNGIDIALDPFPVNGSTTTFEALWMGVPVVTLLGRSMISRWTASMLTAVDRSEWIARTPEEYVELCARLVADPGRLGAWRRSLRSTVAASPLCDARGKARQLERVYRALWCRWCAGAAERAGAVEAEGGRLVEMGRLEEARLYFERALESKPDDTVLLNNAGSVLTLLGLHGEASALFEKALRLDPGYGKARWNLAASLCGHGNALLPASPGEAEALYRRAVEVLPEFVEGHYNLGVLHGERGRLAEAARCYERALSLQPDHFEAALNLGEVLSRLRRHDEAWRVLAPLPERRPDDAKARVALGNAHLGLGRFDEAVASYERALALSPDCGGALNNLGGVLQILGRFDDAVACYRSALTANPDDVTAHRNLLAAILYNKGWSEDDRFAEHRRFAEAHVRDVSPDDASFADRVDPDRRLRVGYLSSDLRDHSVARNLLPVIEARDPARSEVFFYAEVGAPDAMSGRFRALADGWRSTVGLDDRAVAGMIRADAIDVLVCLAGRFDDNRPLVAAYRPAPVQVSYYDAATSGLGTMDALLTDRVMTPRGGRERFSERPVRLPTFYVHGPMDDTPDVVPPPMRANGYPTFGCFNSPAKLGDDVLLLWAWVLQRVPAAKLRLKYRNMFASSSLAERVRAVMGAQGVSPDRLLLEGGDDDGFSHLSLYGGVDIALDPFPFNGSTTTFESLWMGVPVVTLLGTNLMGRWTASMLTAIGRTDLIARTPEAYVDLCARLCADPDRLGEWRRSLRSTVAASPLCDAGGRGRQVDRVYRALWRKWCARARVIG